MTDTITREQARELAVRYNAYCRAIRGEQWREVRRWGAKLIESQKTTGVQLVRPDLIRACMGD